MNEVEELSKLDPSGLPPLKPILLDDLYQSVLKNLHLELGRGPALYLLSPSYSVLNPTPDEGITDFITRNETLLDYLKEAIVQNLAIYSVLIDISSYFIEQNNGLVLARLRERDSEGRRFEIKFYTHEPKELLSRYEDKIYIGRDFLDLFSPVRKYFGLKDIVVSLKAQFERLSERAGAKSQEGPGLRVLLPGDRRFRQRAPQRKPARPPEPAAASRFRQALGQRPHRHQCPVPDDQPLRHRAP